MVRMKKNCEGQCDLRRREYCLLSGGRQMSSIFPLYSKDARVRCAGSIRYGPVLRATLDSVQCRLDDHTNQSII
jgi:hypothetical protein